MVSIQPIVGRKIKLGFIGCGRISQKHFESISKHLGELEVCAVCDIDIERANKVASNFSGSSAYKDISEMLAKEKLDIVVVATPNGLHTKHIKMVADAGVHVLTEKPLSISVKDGVDTVAYCEQKGVQLFVVYQNRFNDTSWRIYEAFKKGRFGKIYMITSNVFWNRNQDYYDKEGSWHGTKDMDGGAFYTQASHYVDFMSWIANADIENVSANLKTMARKIETEDCGVVSLEWQNGIIGSINMTVLTYPKNFEGSITIIGEKGTVKIGGVAMNAIEHWQFADLDEEEEKDIKASNYDTISVYGFGHERYYEHLIKVLRGLQSPLIDGKEGLKSVRILEAIKRSSELGTFINKEQIYAK